MSYLRPVWNDLYGKILSIRVPSYLIGTLRTIFMINVQLGLVSALYSLFIIKPDHIMSEKENLNLQQSEDIIKRHVLFSMGAGFIPIPLIDIIAVSAVQLDMLKQLCKQYGQDYSESSGKALVSTLTGTTIARLTARGVGSVLKSIPLIGSTLGGLTVAAFAGATTYAIGQVVAQHFATGGSILEIKEDEIKVFYKEQLEKGKKVAKEWQAAANSADYEVVTEKQTGTATSLAKAEALLKSGFVTQHEYERIKKRILKEEEEKK